MKEESGQSNRFVCFGYQMLDCGLQVREPISIDRAAILDFDGDRQRVEHVSWHQIAVLYGALIARKARKNVMAR